MNEGFLKKKTKTTDNPLTFLQVTNDRGRYSLGPGETRGRSTSVPRLSQPKSVCPHLLTSLQRNSGFSHCYLRHTYPMHTGYSDRSTNRGISCPAVKEACGLGSLQSASGRGSPRGRRVGRHEDRGPEWSLSREGAGLCRL